MEDEKETEEKEEEKVGQSKGGCWRDAWKLVHPSRTDTEQASRGRSVHGSNEKEMMLMRRDDGRERQRFKASSACANSIAVQGRSAISSGHHRDGRRDINSPKSDGDRITLCCFRQARRLGLRKLLTTISFRVSSSSCSGM